MAELGLEFRQSGSTLGLGPFLESCLGILSAPTSSYTRWVLAERGEAVSALYPLSPLFCLYHPSLGHASLL